MFVFHKNKDMISKKKPTSKGKSISPSKPKAPRRLTSQGLGGDLSERSKSRAAKGAMKQTPNKNKK